MNKDTRQLIVLTLRYGAKGLDSLAASFDARGDFLNAILAATQAKKVRTVAALYENEAEEMM